MRVVRSVVHSAGSVDADVVYCAPLLPVFALPLAVLLLGSISVAHATEV